MVTLCHGNGPDHCCYLPGGVNATEGEGVCPFLERGTVPGRKWVCGLRRELGDWDAVHQDPRYLAVVRPVWDDVVMAEGGRMPDCGDWRANQCCFKRGE